MLLAAHAAPVAVGFASGFWAGFACMAGLHAMLLAATFCVRSTPFCPAVRRVPVSGGEKAVLLTIDDGPCEDTRELLDILDEFQAKAVFFLIGERAAARPDDVREILRRGHAVANHTRTHPAATFWAYPPDRQRREILGCQEILTSIAGPFAGGVLAWFRAPAGFRNPWTGAVLRGLNLRYAGWHARGFDATDTNIPRVLKRLTNNLVPGAVLLVHQGKPHHPELLRRLLTELRDAGWRAAANPRAL